MEKNTRLRAYNCLLNVKPVNRNRKYFKKVWVVGDTIWFTKNAARRELVDQFRFGFNNKTQIEEVGIEEAFEAHGIDYIANRHLIYEGDMEGALFDGELLID